MAAPRRLAELKGKARRFDQWTEKEQMDNVVKGFLNLSIGDGAWVELLSAIDPRPRQILAPQQAFCAQKQRVPLQQAEGRVCAEVANVCPPCACLLCYGEEIDAESVNFLKTYGILCVDVVK